MASSLSHKQSIQPTRYINRNHTNHHRPTKLIRPRKHNRRSIREQLEQILQCGFHGRKPTSLVLAHLILHDMLGAKIKPPKPDPAQHNTADKPTGGQNRTLRMSVPVILLLGICEEHARAACEPRHLPAEEPDAASHGTDLLHEARSRPRCAELEDGGYGARDTDVGAGVAGCEEERDHLSGEGENGEVEEGEGE